MASAGNPAWVKGKSGNPGGVTSKQMRSYRELAQYIRDKTKDGREIVDVCYRIMKSSKADPKCRLLAARELFDRGFGKATQTVDLVVDQRGGSASPKFDGMSVEDKRRLLEAAEQLAALTDGNDRPTEH